MRSVARLCRTALASLCLAALVPSATAMAAEEPNTVRVFYYSLDDVFLGQVSLALQDQALAHDVHLVQYDARNNLVKQIAQLRAVLESDNSGMPILFNPVDMGHGNVALEDAQKRNLPIIFFNRPPDMAAMRKYDKAWYVGTFNEVAGRYQADVVIDYFKSHPEMDKNHDGVLSYVLIKGEEGHIDTVERSRQFQRRMEEQGYKIQLLDSAYADWSTHLAAKHMENMLSHLPEDAIELIVCNNDAMALGALMTLKEHGYNDPDSSESKTIPLIGIDALPAALEEIIKGSMIGTILNDSESIANACMEIAKSYLKGVPVTEQSIGYPIHNRIVRVPYLKITYDTIEDASH